MNNQELAAVIKKNPISVGCGLLSIALIAGIYFRGDEIPKQEAELAEKSAEGERLASNINNSKDLNRQYEALVTANKEIDARLIRSNQLGANAEYFYQLETDTGVKLVGAPNQTLQPGAKGKGAFVPIAFNVTVLGDMKQLLKFLHHLESRAHYCRVLTATCSLNGVRRDSPLTLTLNLELLGLP